MKDALNVAVVGATGMVGEAMLEILAERKFPIARLHPLASERSIGKTVFFERVQRFKDRDFVAKRQ